MTEWLTGTLVATSLLMVAVLVVREPVRRYFGARAAYALWLLPALRMAMPTLTTTVERPPLETVAATPDAILPIAPVGLSPVAPAAPSLFDLLGGWPGFALYLWLAGASLVFVQGIRLYRRQRSEVLALAEPVGASGTVRIVRSHAVRGPMAFGIVDRVVAVPADFDLRFDERQQRLALAHELAHHRHGDIVANHFAFVLLCLQWFNPLAWLSHAAFRFDQEAACDARVLDKAGPNDRVAYGQAIAKAASGRGLLFAGALDRPTTLARRLKSMLFPSTHGRRIAGLALVAGAMILALPMTATWATEYADAPQPSATRAPIAPVAPVAPVASTAPIAPAAPLAALPALAPVPPVPPVAPRSPNVSRIERDSVMIDGRNYRWEDLTPAQRAKIRADIKKARDELDRSRANMSREIAQARAEAEKLSNGEFEREMAEAKVEMAKALAEIDRNAAEIRRAGQDPEQLKRSVRVSLEEVSKMDMAKLRRDALASLDPEVIRASLEEAERSLAEVEANLNRVERP